MMPAQKAEGAHEAKATRFSPDVGGDWASTQKAKHIVLL